ncbi:galactose-3-O-sulfotransferase 2-like [Saccoglossus kowalevskii]|uniref:Galactose-3-O-sulfotransferase 2-like n=1 Tax=Saccoglossus kowalevskii TaxID=10224 RepID=A0ABM0MMK9_SACKO|nr:PREDICTED: galactose-3-O-sulfotransferase 2-like [Saccoglossus kowalevskii]
MFAFKFARDLASCKYNMRCKRVRYFYGVAIVVCTVWTLVYIVLNGTLLNLEEKDSTMAVDIDIANNYKQREMVPVSNQPCEESTNIAFIKVHSASGAVIANILQRFGDSRNLTFILPKEKNTDSAGWPYCFHTNHMLPSTSGNYNILCNHAVYNRREFDKIMPKDTAYVTILRNPRHHFEALFNSYRFGRMLGIHANDPLHEFLNRPDEYVSSVTSTDRFLLQNPMAYDLGFDPEFFKDEDAIMTFIKDIENNFKLVMISDYMEESLVLLKRQMCWTLDEVIYYELSTAKIHSEYRSEMTNGLRDKLREWNFADHALYQHFNKTFWKRVHAEGEDFSQEVEHLRYRNRQIYDFCMMEKLNHSNKFTTVKLPFDKTICEKLDTSVPEYTNILRNKPNQYLKWEL